MIFHSYVSLPEGIHFFSLRKITWSPLFEVGSRIAPFGLVDSKLGNHPFFCRSINELHRPCSIAMLVYVSLLEGDLMGLMVSYSGLTWFNGGLV